MKIKAGDILNLNVKISISRDLEIDENVEKDLKALIYNYLKDKMDKKYLK